MAASFLESLVAGYAPSSDAAVILSRTRSRPSIMSPQLAAYSPSERAGLSISNTAPRGYLLGF